LIQIASRAWFVSLWIVSVTCTLFLVDERQKYRINASGVIYTYFPRDRYQFFNGIMKRRTVDVLALRRLKHSLDDIIAILRNCLNGRHVDPELSFPRTAISLTTLRDINMLLRKDSLMKVDKDCKNMSRASQRLQGWRTRSTCYGGCRYRLLFVYTRATYARTYIAAYSTHTNGSPRYYRTRSGE